MKHKDVELTSGKTVKVFVPPIIRIINMVTRKYPKIEKKVAESKTVTGDTIRMVIEDDPEYEKAVLDREEKIDQEASELQILFALKNETVPSDFDIEEEYGDLLRFTDPTWTPRTGIMGRKLDWIEWDLLSDPTDMTRVQLAINDLLSVDREVVEQTKESFPGEVEEQGD